MQKFLLPLALVAAAAAASPATAQAPLGEVTFENSGAAVAQAPFLRGLALLHNFQYAEAAAAFREAQAADPGFAMAFWGEAMTYNHPVWREQDVAAARSALARLGVDPEARRTRARTERERLYLDAVEALYGEGSKETRDRAYSEAMETVSRRYPGDVDARAFYALSLLGLAHEGRDVPLYMRAAALLEEVYPDHLNHPGVLHYLIHSYDDPTHAPLGLRAARRYGAVAQGADHALHMTSHIFLPLGLWDDVAAANIAAMEAVDRRRQAAGEPPVECGHYAAWLVYSDYQRGRADAADAQVERCRAQALAELSRATATDPIEPRGSRVVSYADLALKRLVETGRWLRIDESALPEGRYLSSRVSFAYGDLLAAGDDPSRIRAAHQRLREAVAAVRGARALGFADRLGQSGATVSPQSRREDVLLMQAAALERFHAGDAEAGLAALREAGEAERNIPAEFGPPRIEKPSYELLGDLLTRLGRRAEAAEAYRAALALAPGRRLTSLALGGDANRTATATTLPADPVPPQGAHHH